MDSLTTILIIGFALIFGAFILSRFLGRERKRPQPFDYLAHGDYPAIPGEMRPARKSGGGVSEQGGRAEAHTVIAHDNRRTSR